MFRYHVELIGEAMIVYDPLVSYDAGEVLTASVRVDQNDLGIVQRKSSRFLRSVLERPTSGHSRSRAVLVTQQVV